MERFVEVQGVRVPRFIYGTAWKEHRTEQTVAPASSSNRGAHADTLEPLKRRFLGSAGWLVIVTVAVVASFLAANAWSQHAAARIDEEATPRDRSHPWIACCPPLVVGGRPLVGRRLPLDGAATIFFYIQRRHPWV